jgi:hypothetical protein
VQVCSGNDNNFVVINQKGIDPPSLDLLARAGVSCAPLMLSCFLLLVHKLGVSYHLSDDWSLLVSKGILCSTNPDHLLLSNSILK